MNIYKVSFVGNCPNNNEIDNYTMTIKSSSTIMVEDILLATNESTIKPIYQEELHEFMTKKFKGASIKISGYHLGVKVITK